ncbi:MAG: hypothetical protein Kow00122_02320 [Thermoleophilia bacterium]
MDVDIIAGYLGAGKTSCIQGLIESDEDPAGLAVLVNEFGELGLDGTLLEGTTPVVELASGCICCTLRLDFRTQIKEIADRWRPRRLLIEPTGVATIAQVVKALRHPDLEGRVTGARVVVLVDALTFNERLRESPAFFTAQVAQADLLLLNKIDLVSRARVAALQAALEQLAPAAWVLPTVRGRLPKDAVLPPFHAVGDPGEAEVLTGLDSLSWALPRPVVLAQARRLFRDLAAERFGRVERAKGILETPEGWRRLDVAASRMSEEPSGPAPAGRLVVIGRELRRDLLTEALQALGGQEAGH